MSLVDTDNLMENASSAASEDDADVDNTRSEAADAEQVAARPSKVPRRVSVTLRTVIVAVVICLLTGAAGVLGWLYMGAQEKLDGQAREASNRQRAEEISADYAVNAADMDYQDFNNWKVKLVNGTSPELKDKLTKAADSMEQVLAPLQWKSTAKPLAAKVRSNAGGVYTVDSFVSVLTKTMQAPDGLQSTATYSITIDSNNDWQITDVGGIDSALGK
jgi:Mce-associated membrane protein